MKQLKTKGGPFTERPYYELDEIDRICTEELQSVDLYPSTPGPVRIERFIEKRFKVTPTYDELDPRILGFTRFGPDGVVAIVVSRALADAITPGAERVLKSTMAHEAGHGILHGHLFAVGGASSLFENVSEPTKILCREGEVGGVPGRRVYDGRWWEYQANRAIGGLLLPRGLAMRCLEGLVEMRSALGLGTLPDNRREEAWRRLIEVFQVNAPVARIRLDDLYPVGSVGQLTL